MTGETRKGGGRKGQAHGGEGRVKDGDEKQRKMISNKERTGEEKQ